MASGKEILFKQDGDCGNEYIFSGIGPIVLFGSEYQTGVAFVEVKTDPTILVCVDEIYKNS